MHFARIVRVNNYNVFSPRKSRSCSCMRRVPYAFGTYCLLLVQLKAVGPGCPALPDQYDERHQSVTYSISNGVLVAETVCQPRYAFYDAPIGGDTWLQRRRQIYCTGRTWNNTLPRCISKSIQWYRIVLNTIGFGRLKCQTVVGNENVCTQIDKNLLILSLEILKLILSASMLR